MGETTETVEKAAMALGVAVSAEISAKKCQKQRGTVL